MSEREPSGFACQSCGKDFSEHLGLVGTCKELTAAQQRVAGYVDQIKQLQAEVEQLRSIKFQRFSNEDCWIYQGDGEDHLASLVCPVVMSAQQVIELEKAQQRVAELESVYQWVCDEEFAAHVKAAKSKGTTKAMHNQYREAMRRVSERMRKALNQ